MGSRAEMTRKILQMVGESRPWLRLRRRHFLWPAAVGIVLAVAYNAALPLVISTTDVRPTMERMLDAWSGGKSRITGEPDIRFWPNPTLTLSGTTIETTDGNPRTLARIGSITAAFSLISALRGEPALEDIRLIEPVVTLERGVDGALNWERPRWLTPHEPATVGDDTPFGDITIENGRLQVFDRSTNYAQEFPGISGTVKWPSFAGRLNAQLSSVIGGQTVNWSLACDEPLTLLAGRNATLKTSLTSAPLNFSFDGIGNLSTKPFASGRLQVSSASLPALAAWFEGASHGELPESSFNLSANVTTGEQTLKLNDLHMSLGAATATGVLDVSVPADDTPRIEGTLAFDRIDLNGLQPLFAKLPVDPEELAKDITDAFSRTWRVDVRLSTQEAAIGPLKLTDVAAGVMVDHGRASLDIGDSTYASGRLSGRLVLADAGLARGGKLELVLKDADLAAAVADFGFSGPVPSGRGSVNLDLSTDQPFWTPKAADASGRLTLSLANGKLSQFDANAFSELVRKGEFFSLSQAGSGTFDFQRADIEARFSDGSARLNRATFTGPTGSLSVNGVIPYRSGSLALAGTFTDTVNAAQRLRFFVGGSWPNAVISPLSVLGEPN